MNASASLVSATRSSQPPSLLSALTATPGMPWPAVLHVPAQTSCLNLYIRSVRSALVPPKTSGIKAFESMPAGLQSGESMGFADCSGGLTGVGVGVGAEVGVGVEGAATPGGVVPPGIMTGICPLMPPSASSSTAISTVPMLQFEHWEQLDDADEDGDVLVALLWSSSFFDVEGLPSSPMVNVGNPAGGGMIAPTGAPAAGMTMMPKPSPTNQMGKIVGCPS
jgi:hypothetical protein